MTSDVRLYFEDRVIPLVRREFPDLLPRMSIQICGSYGLGTADGLSDLDAIIWLEDSLWKARGGHLQLRLDHGLQRFARPDAQTAHYHPEICVWPLSNLGTLRKVVEKDADPLWDDTPFEDLFEAQEALILWDPPGRFKRLKAATAPERCPDHVWKKKLVIELKNLLYEDYVELKSAVKRHRMLESHILLAQVLRALLRVGFLVNKSYYPWRSHLRWAFERLPCLTGQILPHLDTAVSDGEWERRLGAIEDAALICCRHIASAGVLPEVDVLSDNVIEELIWAERFKAWENPDWHDRVEECKRKAQEQGGGEEDFWIWSWWGWD